MMVLCCRRETVHRRKGVQLVLAMPELIEMAPQTVSANFTHLVNMAMSAAPGIERAQITEVGDQSF